MKTPKEFTEFWLSTFPNTLPINYLFRYDYSDRWVRFHSLPKYKRYPEHEADWKILFHRQNTLIQTLVGTQARLVLVTGSYKFNESVSMDTPWSETALGRFTFTDLPEIPLRDVDGAQYGDKDLYLPVFTEFEWQRDRLNDALRDVAWDEIRFFLIATEQQCLIAPYDGGIDIIAATTEARDALKAQFKAWLPARGDGL